MKTLQLKTLPLLLVELPEGAHGIKMFHDIGRPYISYFVGVETFRHYTDEDVELIGKLTNLPDEWFRDKVVFRSHQPIPGVPPMGYVNYKSEDAVFSTTRESFYSLLEAKEQVYLNGNPFKFPYTTDHKYYDEPYDGTGFYQEIYSGDMVQWQQAEFRTFDPDRTYIFTVKTEEK